MSIIITQRARNIIDEVGSNKEIKGVAIVCMCGHEHKIV